MNEDATTISTGIDSGRTVRAGCPCPPSAQALLVLLLIAATPVVVSAQELIPAAYTPAPVGVNLVSVASYFNNGDIAFDPSGPIENGSGEILASTLSYARTLGVLGRSASLTIVQPYVLGDLEGLYLGEQAYAERSGIGDTMVRFGLNLYGGKAMTPAEFASYRPKTLVGTSLSVSAPTGQYDSTRLINIGTNRWSAKAEIGFVQVVGKWAIDAYVGGAFFSTNTDFFGGMSRSQDPIFSAQVHARYLFRRGLWGAVDANFWYGGKTTVDGRTGDDLQENSRVGLTLVWQVTRRHGLRLAASRGAFTRIGGDFSSFGMAYSYNWMKQPKSP
ncbi:MAG: transporter [Thermoanaerobaculales bacterium]|jgi:hypothetical protein|nr:transporter [Thermoanaerobaculales bacterium]